MAIIITEECINCGACEPECPNNAIYEGGRRVGFSDGTTLKGMLSYGWSEMMQIAAQTPVSMDLYYIVPDKCTECVGFMMSHNLLQYVLLIAVLMI